MLRAFVIHWSPEELPAKVAFVEAGGHKVVGTEDTDGTAAANRVKEVAPEVLVVWMSQRPGHGRVTAAYIRSVEWGRSLPMIFVHQDPEPLGKLKRSKLEEVIPDAILVTPATLQAWLGKVENARDHRENRLARAAAPAVRLK